MKEAEYQALVSGEKSDTDILSDRKEAKEEEVKEALSTKQLLLKRSQDLYTIKFDDLLQVEIKYHLTTKEINQLKYLNVYINKHLNNDKAIDLTSEENKKLLAEFLTYITTDPDLDEEFWLSDLVEPFITQTIMDEYFILIGEDTKKVEKFRKKQHR